jgi:hypothetical protein
MNTIGKSKTINFNLTTNATQVVMVFKGRTTDEVYQQFSYPARDGFTTLETTATGYTGKLLEASTVAVKNDLLIAEMKGWDDNGNNEIKRVKFANIDSTSVEPIERVE